MNIAQTVAGIQGFVLLAYGVFRIYLFLFARAKNRE